jgi:outer membrane protein TolC
VKSSLRDVLTSYELIGATRASRRAAADSLRAIEEQEAAGVALTPEFLLDLKLSTQQRLADAEIQEVQALTGYNTAISQLYQAMGTLLDRNQIEFIAEPRDMRPTVQASSSGSGK